MRRAHLSAAVAAALVVFGGAGCSTLPEHPPNSPSQLAQYRRSGSQEFTPRTIRLHNTQRVLSPDLTPRERIDSLNVLQELGAYDAETCRALGGVLADASTPEVVREAVVGYLTRKDYPGIGRYAAAALGRTRDPRVRARLLEWFQRHPTPEVLATVVRLWASETALRAEDEARYRLTVEAVAGKAWEEALLNGLNTPGFLARGSAMELLAVRVEPARLRRRIAAMPARTQAVRALKYFADRFGYVPRTRGELISAVILHRTQPERLTAAARLAGTWTRQWGYRFNIRDFHLLSRLAADPLRKQLSRRQLVLEVSRAIARRRCPVGRPAASPSPGGGRAGGARRVIRAGRLVDFDSQVEAMTMADLWNLLLLGEMLDRARCREALRIMAERDLQDRTSRWGGLVFYEQGQAEARLYKPGSARGDEEYVPSEGMLQDARDALCWFVGHFGPTASPLGPSDGELASARRWNVYGLTLTRTPGGGLAATYFTPTGRVVELGRWRPGTR